MFQSVIMAIGGVEEYGGREVKPEDNGQLGPDRSGGVPAFPNVRRQVLHQRCARFVVLLSADQPLHPERPLRVAEERQRARGFAVGLGVAHERRGGAGEERRQKDQSEPPH